MSTLEWIPQVQRFVRRNCKPNWIAPRQYTDVHELTYVYEGKGRYIIEGERHEVSSGSLIHIPAGSWWEAYADPKKPFCLCTIHYDVLCPSIRRNPLGLPAHLRVGKRRELMDSIVAMERIWALKEPAYVMMAAATLMSAVCHIQLGLKGEMGSYGDERVQRVADYVLSNIDRQVSTQELADLTGLHPVYLNSLVQRHTGNTLRSFINRIRINVAEDAIVYEHLQVHEAAERYGFSDIYYFSKTFKKFKGYPPSHIRKLRA